MSVISRLRSAGYEVYTREEWGSRQIRAYAERAATSHYRLRKPAPYHFLHLTVTRDGNSIQEGFAGARQVEGYGYTSPPMVSYHMLVTNEGRAFEGQNYGVKGTHTVNDYGLRGFPKDMNMEGYAVALMQDEHDEVTDIQVTVVAACFAAAELEGWVEVGAPIFPHRKFTNKACPGNRAMLRLAEIETLKNQMVKNNLATEWDEMATKAEIKEAVMDAVGEAPIVTQVVPGAPNVTEPLQKVVRQILNSNLSLLQRLDAVEAKVEAARAAAARDEYNGPTAAEIVTAIKAAATPTGEIFEGDIERAVANVLRKGTNAFPAQ